jgi:hypothetical protein
MSRKWTLPTLILFLCSSGAMQANPLDSPGVVYIDGLPCNRACQSYMAWSYRALSARHHEERETGVAVPAEAEIERAEQAARPRVARQHVPVPRPAPHAGKAASNAKGSNNKASSTKKIAAPNSAPQAPKDIPAATAAVTPEKAAEKAVVGGQVPERKLESADRPESAQEASIAASQPAEAAKSEAPPKSEIKPEIALPPPATLDIAAAPAAPAIAAPPAPPAIAALPATAAGVPDSAPRTIQQQVVEATGMADLVTAIGAGREAANKPDNPATGPGGAGDTAKPVSASPDNRDDLVALVLARPEINSVSDLNNKKHCDRGEAVRRERKRQRRADGGRRRGSPIQRSQSRRDRPTDQRASSGRGPDAGLARSRRVVSRHQRLQDVSGSAEGATLAA